MRNIKKLFILVIGISILCTGCFNTKVNEKVVKKDTVKAEKISYDELEKIISNYSDYVNVDVVDVRSEEDFNRGHIIGSINIPYNDLDDIIISNDREIVIYGATISKSKQAANDLINLGYKNVKYIAGLDNWPYDLEN